jgi:hypothetical protein
MNNFKVLLTIILTFTLMACNSTPKKVKLVKKPLISDHYLLMSLINRPVTADQQMMLAFAKEREIYYGSAFVNAVSIKGPKYIDNSSPQNIYSALINNDQNSIALQGPTSHNKI